MLPNIDESKIIPFKKTRGKYKIDQNSLFYLMKLDNNIIKIYGIIPYTNKVVSKLNLKQCGVESRTGAKQVRSETLLGELDYI